MDEKENLKEWVKEFQQFIDNNQGAKFTILVEDVKGYSAVVNKHQLQHLAENQIKYEMNVADLYRAQNIVKEIIKNNPGTTIINITPATLSQQHKYVLMFVS